MEAFYIAGATLAINTLVVIGTMAWKARGIVSHVDLSIAAHDAKMTRMISDHQISDNAEFGTIRREVGETGHSIRSKVTEMELWNRDHFVRRDTFVTVVEGWQNEVRLRFDKIDVRLEKMRDEQ